jgi:hypothetical protein
MASFPPIPDVPFEGLNLAESSLFKALKEAVEILTGARTVGVHAITSDTVTIQPANNQQTPIVSAGGQGFATSYTNGANLAGQTGAIVIINYLDYLKLVQDVQGVANDVARLQNVVNSLIGQLQR